jgi:hypothetical protein
MAQEGVATKQRERCKTQFRVPFLQMNGVMARALSELAIHGDCKLGGQRNGAMKHSSAAVC